MSEVNRYIVHIYPGYRNEVKVDIEKTIENRNLQGQILEVSIPMQSVVEIKNGVERAADKKMFPGYVLLHMVMNDDTWYVVRNTRGMVGFVSSDPKPVLLTEEEMTNFGLSAAGTVTGFEVGDTVVVTSGTWKDTVGAIKSTSESKKAVTINIEMFDCEIPVKLALTGVKKM